VLVLHVLFSDKFGSSWTSSIDMYMHRSRTVQYPIQRCGTADGTNQYRTTRASSPFDHTIFYNLISESELDETLHNTNYRKRQKPVPFTLVLAGCTGKALTLGKTLTIRLWPIRLDCDVAQVGYVLYIPSKNCRLSRKNFIWVVKSFR
jgi:hypothetical protein